MNNDSDCASVIYMDVVYNTLCTTFFVCSLINKHLNYLEKKTLSGLGSPTLLNGHFTFNDFMWVHIGFYYYYYVKIPFNEHVGDDSQFQPPPTLGTNKRLIDGLNIQTWNQVIFDNT